MFVDQSYFLNFTVLSLHLHLYNISHEYWYMYKDISHLIGKVKMKFQQDFQSRKLSYLDACELINLISLD